MDNFVLREIHSANIETELEKIGFDCTYKRFAAEKFRYKNIKILPINLDLFKKNSGFNRFSIPATTLNNFRNVRAEFFYFLQHF